MTSDSWKRMDSDIRKKCTVMLDNTFAESFAGEQANECGEKPDQRVGRSFYHPETFHREPGRPSTWQIPGGGGQNRQRQQERALTNICAELCPQTGSRDPGRLAAMWICQR